MRIYEGSPRQDYEEVLRSIGSFLDQRGMREILLTEAPDGFIIQGLVSSAAEVSTWSDPQMDIQKETYTFLDDDIARFMEGLARRQAGAATPDLVQAGTTSWICASSAGIWTSSSRATPSCWSRTAHTSCDC